jgi:hypothetical protein
LPNTQLRTSSIIPISISTPLRLLRSLEFSLLPIFRNSLFRERSSKARSLLRRLLRLLKLFLRLSRSQSLRKLRLISQLKRSLSKL